MAASDWGLNVNENWQYFNSRLGIALSFTLPFFVFKTGFEWHWLIYCLIIHRVHVFGHSLCLHTYFSHKAFKTLAKWLAVIKSFLDSQNKILSILKCDY